ncbi:outer membrane beta-barrel protein [Pedobacter gandavensis]|uniref:outer membrane beta-barrel protein n=1 Tax=Pedobacter gandavensis TaxID=2679963 RepID=UPI00292F3538|nr:outer membrane beta-barrel protein [Pedobacter gandavensis]
MKTLNLLLIILLLSLSYAKAQDTITGKVLDEAGIAIPFATLKLSSANDNTPALVKLTDQNGVFKLQYNAHQNPSLTVSYLGYISLVKMLSTAQSKLSDTLRLTLKSQENNLAEVSITARKALITQKIDRLVLNISNNSLSTGKSSLEILSLAPGVFVNNGAISINGNGGTRVMVNGKILALNGDDLTNYLNNLRADDIESIEVIAHPPAEYEAQGTGGMLNIILKKQNAAGINGSINAGYTQGRYAGTNEGIRLNFKEDKTVFFINYTFNKLKSYEDSEINRQYVNQPYQFAETANYINNNTGHRINTGLIYDLSKTQFIGLDYVGSFNKKTATSQSVATVAYPNNEQDIRNIGTFPVDMKTNYHNIGLNYNITIDKSGSGFQLLADYTSNELRKNSAAYSTFYNDNDLLLSDTAFRNTTPSNATIYTADARYLKVFGKNSSLTFGAKGVSSVIKNSATFEGLEDGEWENNPEQAYRYDYKEKILAGYFNYTGKILNTDVKLGMRGEYTTTSGNLVTSNMLTESTNFNLFPSFFLKHGLNKDGDNYLSLYYGRRISRPSYNNLNPYESYLNNYAVSRGNPYLKPSFSNVYEIGFTLQGKYSFKAGYQNDKDLVSQLIKIDEQNPLLAIYTHENFGNNKNLSLSVNVPVSITEWWESNTNVEIRHQKINAPDLSISKGMVTLQMNHDFKLSPKTSLNLNAFYLSSLIGGNFLAKNLVSLNIGAQYRLLNNKLLLKTTISDPFYTYKIKGTTVYKDYSSNLSQSRQTRTFNVSMTYNFDLGKAFKSKILQKSSEEEGKRL